MLTTGNIVKTINEAITNPAKNNKKYTHSAINYQLNDNFIGLNFRTNENNDVKIETLRTMANDENSDQDKKNSKFDIYCLELENNEYDLLKKNLSNIKVMNKFTYDYKALISISKDIILQKLKNKLFNSNESATPLTVDLSQSEKSLICSTFVAYILSKISNKYSSYFNIENKILYTVTPNDLTFIPGITYLYGGYWKEYATKTREFVNSHPEMKRYFK